MTAPVAHLKLTNGWTVSLSLATNIPRLAAWPTRDDADEAKIPVEKKDWFQFQGGKSYDGPHDVHVGNTENLVRLLQEIANAPPPSKSVAAPTAPRQATVSPAKVEGRGSVQRRSKAD